MGAPYACIDRAAQRRCAPGRGLGSGRRRRAFFGGFAGAAEGDSRDDNVRRNMQNRSLWNGPNHWSLHRLGHHGNTEDVRGRHFKGTTMARDPRRKPTVQIVALDIIISVFRRGPGSAR
jgi:hypothetical protein